MVETDTKSVNNKRFVKGLSIGNSIGNENNSQQQRSTNNIKNKNTTKLYFLFQQHTNQNKSKGCQAFVNEVFMNFRSLILT